MLLIKTTFSKICGVRTLPGHTRTYLLAGTIELCYSLCLSGRTSLFRRGKNIPARPAGETCVRPSLLS